MTPRSLLPLSCAQIAYNMIKYNKYLSLDDIHELAKELKIKERTIERRLNKSEAPSWVETLYKKGNIIGYRYSKKRTKKVIC
jgi:hypothetical protein